MWRRRLQIDVRIVSRRNGEYGGTIWLNYVVHSLDIILCETLHLDLEMFQIIFSFGYI